MSKFVILTLFLYFQNTLYAMDRTWWKHMMFYEVYLPSYKDSNGDGVGDLSGLISKLDHIRNIGMEALYVSPFYMSPMEESGYDISNFTSVNPLFGTMEDFDELIAEASKRGIKVLIDMVLNHSSDKHPWFIKSVNRIEPYTDYYVWKDPKYDSNGNRIPPNNWLSGFGGSGWEWNEERKQFYFHQFTKQQPDFNLRNNVVKREMKKIFKFWLDKGVAGFRLDATDFLIEDIEFRDDEFLPSANTKKIKLFWDLDHKYTLFSKDSLEFLHQMRVYCDKITKSMDYERILLPETYGSLENLMRYYGTSDHKIVHFPINFMLVLITKYRNATFYHNAINEYLNMLPEGATPSWNSENHDKFRKASLYSEDYEYIFTILVMTLPGVAYIYYGQEIGMVGSRIREDQQIDRFVDDFTLTARDAVRLPMQWDDTINGGFSNSLKTFLPISANYWKINVERQKNEKNSHYYVFKKLSDLRKTDAFKYGAFKSYVISTWVFAFTRISKYNETYAVIMNLGSETEFVNLKITIPNLPYAMKIETTSPNSGYQPNDEIPMNPDFPKMLVLRPFAIMVLGAHAQS